MRLGLLALLLVGCGSSSGFLRDATSASAFEYRMDVAHVRYMRTVQGTAETTTIVCLIPTAEVPRHAVAMADLQHAAQLRSNEVLTNLREDTVTMFTLIYCSTTLTISADVVEVGART